MDARYDRALLYAEVDEPKKAVTALDGILKGRPGEPEVGLPCNTVSMSGATPALSVRQKDILFCAHRLPDHISQPASPCADCIRTAETRG